jgi:hypothetical protein
MKGHVGDAEIRAYRGRTLPPADLLEVSDHIASCEACRVRMASPVEVRAGVSAIQSLLEARTAAGHLTYDDLAAYVDGTMPNEAGDRVELHARECESCSQALEDLKTLRDELQETPRGWQWHRPKMFSGSGLWRGGLALAGGALCFLLIVVFSRSTLQQGPGRQAQNGPPRAGELPSASRANAGDAIRDGNRVVTIGAAGAVAGLESIPLPYRTLLERALVAKEIPVPGWMPELEQRRGVLLGAPEARPAIRLLSPVGTAVDDPRPVFRWTTVPGAEYQLTVYDGNYSLVGDSGWSSSGEARLTRALDQGTRYSWQIHLRRGGEELTFPTPPAPEARFRVLGETERADVARARGALGDSHLTMGVVYASAGLLDEADRELGLAANQNPDSETLAALRARVEQLRANRSRP